MSLFTVLLVLATTLRSSTSYVRAGHNRGTWAAGPTSPRLLPRHRLLPACSTAASGAR